MIEREIGGPIRVLDIDLDFFLVGAAHLVDPDSDRLDPDEFPPWPIDEALAFLSEKCGLSGKLPGFAVEYHDEVFYRWGEAIEAGDLRVPMEVVHVDAHADLGLGDAAFMYLMTELAFEPINERYETLKDRRLPTRDGIHDLSNHALNDANWLMFAVACGWISDLTYVTNSRAETTRGARPGDLMRTLMKDFNLDANELQVVGTHDRSFGPDFPTTVEHADPPVPFHTRTYREFQSARPFDMVCLTRSPEYTPAEADPIFDAIRDTFIQ